MRRPCTPLNTKSLKITPSEANGKTRNVTIPIPLAVSLNPLQVAIRKQRTISVTAKQSKFLYGETLLLVLFMDLVLQETL